MEFRNSEVKMLKVTPSKASETIHIAFCINRNYIQHLGVALTSVCVNNYHEEIEFHVLCDGLEKPELEKFSILSERYKRRINFYVINASVFKQLKISDHFSLANYYRLAIPYVIPESIPKILYLDADLVCNSNLTELWNTDINDVCVAACPKNSQERIRTLQLSSGLYFNSGVMLMNVRKWLDSKLSVKATEFIAKNPDLIHAVDQDGLNKVLDGDFRILDDRWNNTIKLDSSSSEKVLPNAAIIHFVGSLKPWQKCPDSNKHIYWKYLSMSPWADAELNRPKTVEEKLSIALESLILSLFVPIRRLRKQFQSMA